MAVPCSVLPGALLCAEMETRHGPARTALRRGACSLLARASSWEVTTGALLDYMYLMSLS